MADVYDIVGAFQDIEMELIKSMKRTMKKHIGDEMQEEINWTQWQAEMLNGLAQYKAENKDKLQGYYHTINEDIEEAIKQAFATGESEQEIEILKAIQEGYKADKAGKGTNSMQGAFFKVNEKKLNALIDATTKDMKKAENAILRMTDDAYRKTIFKAQMFYNTGAGTLWKAVDMATKDFMQAGINCVEYKNGARVNIASYAEMALRTANKRANLMGSAGKREEWGIHTVKVSKHGSACPKCVKWQGKVYIDDVYGLGTKEESRKSGYPLLSVAVRGGMFHPNCKNGCSTYYEGINQPPKEPTKAEIEEMARRYSLEQRQRECERNIRKYKRLENGSLDADNVAKYAEKRRQWTNEYNKLIANNPDVLRADQARLKLYGITASPKANKSWHDAKRNSKSYDSKKDIIAHLKDKYDISFSDSKKAPIDKDLLEDCINWLDNFTENFKEFADKNNIKIPAIKVKASSGMHGSVGYYSYYPNNHKVEELALNSAFHGNASYFESYVKKCVESKWYPENSTTHKTFVHEYGHHVSNSLCAMYGEDWEKNFIKECINDFKKKVPDYKYNNHVGLKDYLSGYGATKRSECFAEAFAEYFGGDNPRTFAKIFGKKLEKILKGVK